MVRRKKGAQRRGGNALDRYLIRNGYINKLLKTKKKNRSKIMKRLIFDEASKKLQSMLIK